MENDDILFIICVLCCSVTLVMCIQLVDTQKKSNYYRSSFDNTVYILRMLIREIDTLEHSNMLLEEELSNHLGYISTLEHDSAKYMNSLKRCLEDLPSVMWIGERTANENQWTPHIYDCTEFSRDLVIELEQNGYVARVVRGYYHDVDGVTCDGINLEEFNCRHEWVCLGSEGDTGICIESVTGKIIPHSQYGTVYKFVDW